MLKSIFFSLLISIPTFANESPIDLNGEYSYRGKIKLGQMSRNEPVYAFTNKGRERLKYLKSQGWTCTLKPRQTYLCSKKGVTKSIPIHIKERAEKLYTSLTVEFEEKNIEPVLVNDAPLLKTYRFFKEVRNKGKVYPYFDYTISTIHKVSWGEGLDREEFVVWDDNTLWNLEFFSDQERTYYDRFLVVGDFQR